MVCPAATTAGGAGEGPEVSVALAPSVEVTLGVPTLKPTTSASPGLVRLRVKVIGWPALTVAGAAVRVALMPAAPMVKLPEVALPDDTDAPELASVPDALEKNRTVPAVLPATNVQVNVVPAPALSEATEGGTAPVPALRVAIPAGSTVGAAGTTLLASASPRLITVIVTGNSWPRAAEPEEGRLAVSAAGRCTVTTAGFVGSVAPSRVVPEKLSVAWADPERLR